MIETEVSPVAETQNLAADPVAHEDAGNATPEQQAPSADAPKPADEQPEDESSKALKRMQRRIDKRTADLYRERAEKEALAERIAALESKITPTEPVSVDPKEVERFVAERAKVIAEQQRFNERCNSVAEEGSKAFPDFEPALVALRQELPLFDQRGAATPIMGVIMEMDNPARVIHYLGTHPDVASELADLSPTKAAVRLDRIERELADKPKVSPTPKPLTPEKGASGTGRKDPSEMSYAEFVAWRKKSSKR